MTINPVKIDQSSAPHCAHPVQMLAEQRSTSEEGLLVSKLKEIRSGNGPGHLARAMQTLIKARKDGVSDITAYNVVIRVSTRGGGGGGLFRAWGHAHSSYIACGGIFVVLGPRRLGELEHSSCSKQSSAAACHAVRRGHSCWAGS